MTSHIPFDNSYARLPDRFFARIEPSAGRAPRLLALNRPLAEELGLDPEWLAGPEGLAVLAGMTIPEGAEPIALAYAGHQFGHFSPQLGDGRAILLGELLDRNGKRRDVQLKGAGITPFSRRGDGRAALGPVLREYIVSEAMAALGVPTTRALAAVTTGERVIRETALPGAIITRIAASHIRVGTFQFFAARGDTDAVRLLADHVIARHYLDAAGAERPYRALLDGVIEGQAELIARWLLIGFIHGVMNTDNMAVSGETIDYGPCAFMDAYDPATVFSAIDQHGRYAYGNQPRIAQWNLARFAEALLPLLAEDQEAAIADAQESLGVFADLFQRSYQAGLRRKIGLATVRDGDDAFLSALLEAMAVNQVDFTLFFRRLGDVAGGAAEEGLRALFVDPTACDAWLAQWRARLALEDGEAADRAAAMHRVNPAYIPRNHQVEAVIRAAVDREDFAPFHALLAALAEPFVDQPHLAHYAEPPQADERVLQTFCGT
jgi:uncharacterized protein YdiU (UPF0061 family)